MKKHWRLYSGMGHYYVLIHIGAIPIIMAHLPSRLRILLTQHIKFQWPSNSFGLCTCQHFIIESIKCKPAWYEKGGIVTYYKLLYKLTGVQKKMATKKCVYTSAKNGFPIHGHFFVLFCVKLLIKYRLWMRCAKATGSIFSILWIERCWVRSY